MPRGWTIRDGSTSSQRGFPGRRDQRPAAACEEGASGEDRELHDEAGRSRRAEREPDHAASRLRRGRGGRNSLGLPFRPQLAVRDGIGRRGFLRRQHRRDPALPLSRRGHKDRRGGDQARRPSGRSPQPSLDEDDRRRPGRDPSLCERRLEQQRRRARHGRGGRAGGDLGDRPRHRRQAAVRDGSSQRRRPCDRASQRGAVGGGERARRARKRPVPIT